MSFPASIANKNRGKVNQRSPSGSRDSSDDSGSSGDSGDFNSGKPKFDVQNLLKGVNKKGGPAKPGNLPGQNGPNKGGMNQAGGKQSRPLSMGQNQRSNGASKQNGGGMFGNNVDIDDIIAKAKQGNNANSKIQANKNKADFLNEINKSISSSPEKNSSPKKTEMNKLNLKNKDSKGGTNQNSARQNSSRQNQKPDTVKSAAGKVNNTNSNASPQKRLGKKNNSEQDDQVLTSPPTQNKKTNGASKSPIQSQRGTKGGAKKPTTQEHGNYDDDDDVNIYSSRRKGNKEQEDPHNQRLSKMKDDQAAQIYEKRKNDIMQDIKAIKSGARNSANRSSIGDKRQSFNKTNQTQQAQPSRRVLESGFRKETFQQPSPNKIKVDSRYGDDDDEDLRQFVQMEKQSGTKKNAVKNEQPAPAKGRQTQQRPNSMQQPKTKQQPKEEHKVPSQKGRPGTAQEQQPITKTVARPSKQQQHTSPQRKAIKTREEMASPQRQPNAAPSKNGKKLQQTAPTEQDERPQKVNTKGGAAKRGQPNTSEIPEKKRMMSPSNNRKQAEPARPSTTDTKQKRMLGSPNQKQSERPPEGFPQKSKGRVNTNEIPAKVGVAKTRNEDEVPNNAKRGGPSNLRGKASPQRNEMPSRRTTTKTQEDEPVNSNRTAKGRKSGVTNTDEMPSNRKSKMSKQQEYESEIPSGRKGQLGKTASTQQSERVERQRGVGKSGELPKGRQQTLEEEKSSKSGGLRGKKRRGPGQEQSAEQEATLRKNRSAERYKSPMAQPKGPAQMKKKQSVHNFDKPLDEMTFDEKLKYFEIQKRNRIAQHERDQAFKEEQECTFQPKLNFKPTMGKNYTNFDDFYQANREWQEKKKNQNAMKAEEIFNETTKSNVIKNKSKSIFLSPHEKSYVNYDKPPPSLVDFENKFKVVRIENTLRASKDGGDSDASELVEQFNIFNGVRSASKGTRTPNENRSAERLRPPSSFKPDQDALDRPKDSMSFTYNYKQSKAKEEFFDDEDDKKMALLKKLLLAKEKDDFDEMEKRMLEQEIRDIYITSNENPEELLRQNFGKHIEIKNNRYILTDTNDISEIEKKDGESYDMSFNFEDTRVKKSTTDKAIPEEEDHEGEEES